MSKRPQSPSLDTVTTIREDGSRRFLFPADATGKYSRARLWSAIGLIAVYILLPWIKVGGYPAVFLDVANRRFHLFGLTLAAHDMWLLFFLITGLGFTLFFITALLGRIWCGWACPHSVFLDQVYRRIERLVEGDAFSRRKLDAAPWTGGKLARRILKHGLYLIVSSLIAHFVLAYFVSLPELWKMIHQAPGKNWGLFLFVSTTTGALYFNFAWFREQLCIVLCPYGRLQSVLIDDNSLVIGYDKRRGEPRGKVGTEGAGDCVACNRCVQVCPTGIDIRQGLQMECIGCSACIDACDDVMRRTGRQEGLVRYDSLNGLEGRPTRWLRPRTIIYFVLLFVGTLVTFYAFSKVTPANFAVTRMVGAPYVFDAQSIRNQYMIRIVNKSAQPAFYTITTRGAGKVDQLGASERISLSPMAEEVRPFVVVQDRTDYRGPFKFELVLQDAAGSFELKRTVEFIGPDASLLREAVTNANAPGK